MFFCPSVSKALFFGYKFLKSLASGKLDTELILCHLLQIPRAEIRLSLNLKLSLRQSIKFYYQLFRRANNTPLSYILESKSWAGLNLALNKNVLIPRDETEILVNIITSCPRIFRPQKILDLGTGSGCIAIFLANFFSNLKTKVKIIAIDNSKKTLELAQKNTTRLAQNSRENFTFLHSNLLEKIKLKDHFDIIVANLPYVPRNFKVPPQVKKEPKEAIFSGKSGTEHYQRLAKQISKKQITFLELWLEFLPFQKTQITQIFASYKIQFFPTLSGEIFFAKIWTAK